MGRGITVAILAVALALAAPLGAHAAGLGKLNVLSPLGQPLNAEIEIVALRPGEEEGLVARVAPAEAFTAAGIEPSHILSSMRFEIERRGSQRILRVTTQAAINEPFVELLIELQWSSGRLVREYTFLLDPPEYKAREAAREAVAAAPKPAPAKPVPAEEMKPAPPVEAKPLEPAAPPPALIVTPAPTPVPSAETPAPAPAPAETPAPAPTAETPTPAAAAAPAQEPVREAPLPLVTEPEGRTYEVRKGDTLGGIARDNLPPGITLNQMLIAIYRANQDAFIRENVNLVRAGRILNIPTADAIGSVDADEANRIVRAHMAEFREYRSRLAAVAAPADAAPGQREEAAGRIEPKPAPPAAAPQDQVRLSKADPQKPSAAGARAAREDDLKARERAQSEAQSRINDLEKTVTDLQKMLEIRNQQLAELQKKAGEKPAAAAPAPAPIPAPAAKTPEKPAAEAPKPAPEAPKPAAEAPKPAAPAPAAPAVKPAPKPAAPPPPADVSVIDEIIGNPTYLAALGAIVLMLVGYFFYAWRKKKAAHAKFQDSVMGAAAAGAAAGAGGTEPSLAPATPPSSQTGTTQPPAAAGGEEVDPIAEADVYMAYGRDAQAEEILREALQKDDKRAPVHAKLLEIFAKRKDTKAFEQTALKLKNVTNGAGPEWEKAVTLGHSIDPGNGLYAGAAARGAAAAAPAAAAPAAPAPTLDFDIGGAAQASATAPDLTLDAAPKPAADAGLDFDVSGATEKTERRNLSSDETVLVKSEQAASGLDFNLDLGGDKPAAAAPAPAAAAAPDADPGLSFDLNLDLGGDRKADAAPAAAAAAPDLSSISLDLGTSEPAAAPAGGTDPKWQEIATKLDLAKAYEEMGDKDGARELLNEVMKDGDAAQKGTAQQLLARLG